VFSPRRIIALIVCVLLVAIVLQAILPAVGIPKSRLLPPPQAFAAAKGKTRGIVTGTDTEGTSNPFKVGEGERYYYIDYTFQARVPPMLGQSSPGKIKRYEGHVRVDKEAMKSVKPGQPMPVRYETTFPEMNGIDGARGGRTGGPTSAVFSTWLFYPLVSIFLGYLLFVTVSPFLKQENI